jgi:hypothetical protein
LSPLTIIPALISGSQLTQKIKIQFDRSQLTQACMYVLDHSQSPVKAKENKTRDNFMKSTHEADQTESRKNENIQKVI